MGYRQVTLNGAIKKKKTVCLESQKERVIHLSELRNYVNIFYGNSILMKRENIKYLPQNSKVMKRFPEGHIPQHAPIPGRQYNTIKTKTNRMGEKVHLPGLLQ